MLTKKNIFYHTTFVPYLLSINTRGQWSTCDLLVTLFYSPGLTNCTTQEGHVIRKDPPEARTFFYKYTENGETEDLIDYNAISEELRLFLLLFIKFAILCFVTFVKWFYLNYSGDIGQKIIRWRTAQSPQASCIYAWHKRCSKPFKEEICLFYIRTQCVPRVKHSPPQLHESSMLMFCKVKVHTEHLKAMWAPCRIFEW